MSDAKLVVITWSATLLCLCALGAVLLWTDASPSVAPAAPHSGTTAGQSLTTEQIDAARAVLQNVRGLATITEDADFVEVRFNLGVVPTLDREKLYRLVNAISDADAAVMRRARHLDFFDATGERIAVASPLTGITLTK